MKKNLMIIMVFASLFVFAVSNAFAVADIAASDVTIIRPESEAEMMVFANGQRMVLAEITFGNGTLTYPTGGVPLPVIGHFGFNHTILAGFVDIDGDASGYRYEYDDDNHKVVIYVQGVTTGSTAVADETEGALIEDHTGSEGDARLFGTAVDTTYDFGPLIELPTTATPAATTLRIMFIGR